MKPIQANSAAEHVKEGLRRVLSRLGVRVMRRSNLSHPLDRRRQLLISNEIDLVLDVGANEGQYARSLRELDYGGRIVSFEPMREPFKRLSEAARKDEKWEVRQLALGNMKKREVIHIAGNSISSSLLPMMSAHELASPQSRYIGEEEIDVDLFDNVFPALVGDAKNVWLKLDVQGYEDRVLEGASATLQSIHVIQIELSLTPLYDGQSLYGDLAARLGAWGFRLVDVEPVFWDKSTGELLAMDGIFVRT